MTMKAMTMKEKMLAGLPYRQDEPLVRAYHDCARRIKAYNELGRWQRDEMDLQIRGILGTAGDRMTLNPPFYCDYGTNIHIGSDFFSNYNLTILDVAPVRIGDHVMLGPNVALYTAGHPLHPDPRNAYYEWGAPITIGDNVWIGGNVVVNPGVTIGSNSVIGSGSVVTRDLPEWSLCAGNPCRVIRAITEEDRRFYRRSDPWPPDHTV